MEEFERARRRRLWAEWLEHIETAEAGAPSPAFCQWMGDLSYADRCWLHEKIEQVREAARHVLVDNPDPSQH